MQKQLQNGSSGYLFCIGLSLLVLFSGCARQQRQSTHEEGVWYSGYSAGFQDVKHNLYNGEYTKLVHNLDERDAQLKAKHQHDDSFAQDMGMLNLLESSSLYLQTGNVNRSLEYCRFAEELIEQKEDDSLLFDWARRGWSVAGPLIGAEGYSAYDPVGYEKVLLLNLEAMNYLLKGDDRAFNVARKSTEWQETEREKFAEKLESIKEIQSDTSSEQLDVVRRNQVFARLAKEFSKYDKKALKVSSAFVNPFGDYLAGIVKEFKSVELGSQMDNARIHYEKALRLNPTSRVLQLAAKDMKNRRSASRLVQIVAFDGFVPEKKILSFDLRLKKSKVPVHIEVPLYEPVKSRVHKIVASTAGGTILATFRPVADIEAMALRQQKDNLPAIQALVAVAAIRDTALTTAKVSITESINKQFRNSKNIAESLQSIVGALSDGIDASLEPDTSSWMSLPSKILAARFHPAKNIKKIRITSYDVNNRKLVQETVTLGEGGRHFIFVRSLDNRLKVVAGKKIWSPKERQLAKK